MSVGSIGWKTLYNAAKGYAKRAGKLYPGFVTGTANDVMSAAMKSRIKGRAATGESWFKAVKGGFKDGILAAEKYNNKVVAKNGGNAWAALWKNIKTIPSQIGRGWKVGGARAASLGKSKLLGSLKGALKGVGTRMPLIGTLLLAAFSLPDIVKATANEGIASGGAEVLKVAARVGGGTLAAAVGTAILGPLGGIVGYAVGDWLTSKVVGKSYSERKLDQEQKIAEEVEKRVAENTAATTGYQQVPFGGLDPYMMMQMQQLMGNGGNIFERDIFGNPFAYNPQQTPASSQESDKEKTEKA